MAKRDFLTLDDVTAEELTALLDAADAYKADRPPPAQGLPAQGPPAQGPRQSLQQPHEGQQPHGGADQAPRGPLAGATVALIFEKPSMRTRVSFAVAVRELGGDPLELSDAEIQLDRRETIEDAAAVLTRYVHAIVLRTTGQERVERLARAARVPVINALSDYAHPCQALADMQTIREHTGRLAGVRLTYLGDGNNVAHSLLEAGAKLGLHTTVASPTGYEPIPQVVRSAAETAETTGGSVQVTNDPQAAVKDADVVYTDVWASMGAEDEAATRSLIFQPYQLGADLLASAAPDAIVLHCLPAHRDDEITADVLDGPRARVGDQAENRLHTTKALLAWLLTGTPR